MARCQNACSHAVGQGDYGPTWRLKSATLLPDSPADFGKLLANETEKWARVVKFSGAKQD